MRPWWSLCTLHLFAIFSYHWLFSSLWLSPLSNMLSTECCCFIISSLCLQIHSSDMLSLAQTCLWDLCECVLGVVLCRFVEKVLFFLSLSVIFTGNVYILSYIYIIHSCICLFYPWTEKFVFFPYRNSICSWLWLCPFARFLSLFVVL